MSTKRNRRSKPDPFTRIKADPGYRGKFLHTLAEKAKAKRKEQQMLETTSLSKLIK